MFCSNRSLLGSARVLILLTLCVCLANTLEAQSSTPSASPTPSPTPVDPGPRPVGTQGANNFCPGLSQAKFPSAPACIDVDQPAAGNAGGAGNVIGGTAGNLTPLWFEALTVFETPATVGGPVNGTPAPQTGGSSIPGLGPSFNATSCFQCHSQPAVGGSSPNTSTPGFANGNPQVGDAPTSDQASAVSSFVFANGPVREVRFPKGFAGTPKTFVDKVQAGSVAELFAVTSSMGQIPNCSIGQEPFQTELSNGNAIFRIPIPTFGDGLVEATPDATLVANVNSANSIANNTSFFNPALGISGTFNRSGNDGTITRFGWKAQNKSLLMFAGEASNVEMGVTNELFPNEKTIGNGDCAPNNEPEDQVVVLPDPTDPNSRSVSTILSDFSSQGVSSDVSNNIENFAVFMRLNAAPSQCDFNSGATTSGDVTTANCKALSATAQRGAALFGTMAALQTAPATPYSPSNPVIVGCVLCHTDTLTSGPAQTPGLSNQSFNPFSDFAIHTMDPSFADGVTQGSATSQEFRSAPLWGAGQRIFFMHDGGNGAVPPNDLTPDGNPLFNTIEAHCLTSSASSAASTSATKQSEACGVIAIFNALPATSACPSTSPNCNCNTNAACTSSQQDILNFLRSL